MFYIDAYDKPKDARLDSTIEAKLFVFDTEAEDYFLKYFFAWDLIKTEFFEVSLDGSVFFIPSGTYMLCGCVGGSQDWLTIDEMIGRPIDVFVMNKGMRGWTLSQPKILGVSESSCYFPMVKSPIPVMSEDGRKCIVVSAVDQYHKLKDRDFDIFFI